MAPNTINDSLAGLLAMVDRTGRSLLELRILLWLSDREVTPLELADGLAAPCAAISHATRSLSMHGLARQRFEYGTAPGFVYAVTPAGCALLEPLLQARGEMTAAQGQRVVTPGDLRSVG